MSRAYSFLEGTGLRYLANPYNLPWWYVRLKGQTDYERQPARSIEDSVAKFIQYAGVKVGSVVQALPSDKDPAKDKPFEYPVRERRRMRIK